MGTHVCAVHLVSQQLHMLLVPRSKGAHTTRWWCAQPAETAPCVDMTGQRRRSPASTVNLLPPEPLKATHNTPGRGATPIVCAEPTPGAVRQICTPSDNSLLQHTNIADSKSRPSPQSQAVRGAGRAPIFFFVDVQLFCCAAGCLLRAIHTQTGCAPTLRQERHREQRQLMYKAPLHTPAPHQLGASPAASAPGITHSGVRKVYKS